MHTLLGEQLMFFLLDAGQHAGLEPFVEGLRQFGIVRLDSPTGSLQRVGGHAAEAQRVGPGVFLWQGEGDDVCLALLQSAYHLCRVLTQFDA